MKNLVNIGSLFVIGLILMPLVLLAETHFIWDNDRYETFRNSGVSFQPGDRILFRSGKTYTGQLAINNLKGSVTNPIIISSYRSGDLPIIECTEQEDGALFLTNPAHVEISNLHIRNVDNASPVNENSRICGIFIKGENSSTQLDNIIIKNCLVTDVHGVGILVGNNHNENITGSFPSNSYFNNVRIENNTIRNNDYRGIMVRNYYNHEGRNDIDKSRWFTNVIVRSNYVENIYRNGIVVWGCNSPIIEYNTVKRAGNGSNGQGIFIAYTEGAKIQFNEVYEVVYNNNDGDAGGIGIDYYSLSPICQYNYLHDNDMNGIAVMANGTSLPVNDAIIRYNICHGNGLADGSHDRVAEIRISGPVQNCQIYNNLFYSNHNSSKMIFQNTWNGSPISVVWKNNIFYHNGNGGYTLLGRNYFSNNCFFNNHPSSEPTDLYKVTLDPNFIGIPNPAPENINWNNLAPLNGYKLSTGSSCFGVGEFIPGNGGKDFYNNAINSQIINIGIFESSHGANVPVITYFTNEYNKKFLHLSKTNDVVSSSTCDEGSKWIKEDATSGYVWFRNYRNGKYLRHSTSSGVKCNEDVNPNWDSFKWREEDNHIRNKNSNLYLKYSPSSSQQIICDNYHPSWQTEQWLQSSDILLYTIRNTSTNKILCINDLSDVNLRSLANGKPTHWIIEKIDDTYSKIKSSLYGKYLRYSPTPGVICFEDYNENWNSFKWLLIEDQDGIKIKNGSGDLYLRWSSSANDVICTSVEPGWTSHIWQITESNIQKEQINNCVVKNHFKGIPGLHQNFPNPFKEKTNIKFSLANDQLVKISIYSIAGRKISTLSSKRFKTGTHNVLFEGKMLVPGQYFCKIETSDFQSIRRMIKIK